MKKPMVFSAVLAAVIFYGGCSMVGIMSTPGRHEREIPAEYKLIENAAEKKILILVEQPAWLETETNLMYHVTNAVRKSLIQKVDVLPENIVPYSKLSEFRSSRPNFSLMSAANVGKSLAADLVILIEIKDHDFCQLLDTKYYKGSLEAQIVLLDTASGDKLWPKTDKSKLVKVGFEAEGHGRQAAVIRLTDAFAYCTTRYFYDCKKAKFKISDDTSVAGWKSWQD